MSFLNSKLLLLSLNVFFFYRDYIWEALQEAVASDVKNTRKLNRKTSCARTRDFGTQTSPKVKRWVSTKTRQDSCTIGVQVDSATCPSPTIDKANVNSSNTSSERLVDSAAEAPPAPNSSVEVCRHCKQTFIREAFPKQTPTFTSKTNPEEIIPRPNVENLSTKVENQRLSFTKIRKSSPPTCVKNQKLNHVLIEAPIVKSIIPTSNISPKSSIKPNGEPISRTNEKFLPDIPTCAPIPPPLPTMDQHQPQALLVDKASSPPPSPPPLPPAVPTCSSIPAPPPLPSSPPLPPPLPQSQNSHIPPSMPDSIPQPPPPPPLPSLRTSHNLPQPQSEAPCFSPPPPPPPPMNGPPLPACEPLLYQKVVDDVFAPSAHKTTSSNYHTLPARKLNNTELKTAFNKFNTLPKPSKKMKTLNWTKVPNQTIGNVH